MPAAHAAAHFQTIKSFGFPDLLGSQPEAPLIEGTDGALYGTTYGAANKYAGTVFRMNKDGSGYRVLYKFSLSEGDGRRPYGGVIEATDGALYGTTLFGGVRGRGTVFKLNKDGSGYARLHSLQGSPTEGAGCFAGLLEGSDGALYGTTLADGSYGHGTIFRLRKDGSNFQTLHHFQAGDADGAAPRGGLLEGLDGALYGTTAVGGVSNAGVAFKISKDGTGYMLLRSFGADVSDGKTPSTTLLRASDGVLYGTTLEGGTTLERGTTSGTIFKLNEDGSAYSVLHRFGGPPDDGRSPFGSLIEGSDGSLYGTTELGGTNGGGTIFRISRDGSGHTNLQHFNSQGQDGWLPEAGLIQASDHLLYGTTREGGASRMGTAFKLNTDGSGYSVIHDFNFSGGDGFYPTSVQVGTNGILYGMTQDGGAYRDGTAFKLNADGSEYTLAHHFVFANGRVPAGNLAMIDATLYGSTFQGGTNDLGTIFKLGLDGSNFSILRRFGDFPGDGARPGGGLLKAQDGLLYGTTIDNSIEGGSGTVFRVEPDGNSYEVVHTFGSIDGDGQNPSAALIEDADGLVYGTTRDGGKSGYGTIFKMNKNGTSYSILHNFSTISGEGQNPAWLLEAKDGRLYGATFFGGTNGSGTVFRLSKDGGAYSVLHSFDGTPYSANPSGSLWEGDDGALYGTTRHGGAENVGSIFRLSKDGSDFEILHSFSATGDGGYEPWTGLHRGPDGALYGTTYYGGELGLGTVFKLWPPQTPDILSVKPMPKTVEVIIAGAANGRYQILRSADLKNWFVLTTLLMPTEGVYSYEDTSPAIQQAFYRAAWTP